MALVLPSGTIADLAFGQRQYFRGADGVDATFTLPGLAGIVLTVGMAVDRRSDL